MQYAYVGVRNTAGMGMVTLLLLPTAVRMHAKEGEFLNPVPSMYTLGCSVLAAWAPPPRVSVEG